MDICPKCGLPKEICVCEKIEGLGRKIEVKRQQAKFKKIVTIVKGIGKSEIDKIAKELKKKLACGGTVKDDIIILQGDHTQKIKNILVSLGYDEKEITVD
ncbi:MAG: stress response translation initiation inhibitor YciH [Candidatus Micrarchaeia archaeon]